MEEVPAQHPNVITVTLSPSLDRTLITHYLALGYHNRTEASTRLDPAGEGVNIVRALHRLSGDGHAIILLGNDATGYAYRALIVEEGFDKTVIQVDGRTRSSTIILDTGSQEETHIIEDAAGITHVDVEQLVGALTEHIEPGDMVVLAGPLPPSSPRDTYAWLTGKVREAGGKVVIVAGGEALVEVLKVKPDLVALSEIQAEAHFNYPVRTPEDILASAQRLREEGARAVLLEMRELGGAALVVEEGQYIITLPESEEGTTSGIWDALLAGYLAGSVYGRSPKDALTLGAASAAFTLSQVGSEFGTLEEIQEFVDGVELEEIDATD
jgi:1-phosphofructokinase family hexose kinase